MASHLNEILERNSKKFDKFYMSTLTFLCIHKLCEYIFFVFACLKFLFCRHFATHSLNENLVWHYSHVKWLRGVHKKTNPPSPCYMRQRLCLDISICWRKEPNKYSILYSRKKYLGCQREWPSCFGNLFDFGMTNNV